ncbi:Zeatin O-glucosyltransferase [Stylosanthes scabra]|uniref:Glycosyltransferase n=1 Tax=Stylosanthes scabra TaxID=79078 RepID=A0ABU6W9V7_9FABA|nr:Zeatin O-glucosyltransferase [Stylosanthes scabra]
MASSSFQTSPTSTNYKTTLQNNTHHGTTTKAHQQAQKAHHHHHEDHTKDVVVVVVPFPAQGHLNQLLHLSRIILSYNIPLHFVGTPTHNRQALTRLHGWDWDPHSSLLNFHDFNVPPFPSPPPDPNALHQTRSRFPSHLLPSFQTSASHLRDPVRALLASLSSAARRVVVIHDSLMASVVQDAVSLSNCESYTFHSVSAFTMFFYFWDVMGRPKLESSIITSHIPEVPSLEGCFTSQFADFITSQYEFHKFSKGTIYNTTRAVEGPYMDLIERMVTYKTHWALGPFNPLISSCASNNKHPCMEWLDEQEENSVLYVSFGTTTAFKEEQIMELATGLEQSKQKFIWVLRDADKGDVFKEDNDNNNDGKRIRKVEVPKGYEERVKGMGIVVRDWAPQLDILGHPATGGFMSHCGWNSCMESITMGVPIAAWPMHSDQPRNRVLITEVLRIGVVVKGWSNRDEVVAASEIEGAVSRLMATEEGKVMRERATRLKCGIHKSKDEGGVSRLEIDSFIAHITR